MKFHAVLEPFLPPIDGRKNKTPLMMMTSGGMVGWKGCDARVTVVQKKGRPRERVIKKLS
jgi:hypothetical protein